MENEGLHIPWFRMLRSPRSLSATWSPHNILAVIGSEHVHLVQASPTGATRIALQLGDPRISSRSSSDHHNNSSSGGMPILCKWHPKLDPNTFPATAALAILFSDGALAVFHVTVSGVGLLEAEGVVCVERGHRVFSELELLDTYSETEGLLAQQKGRTANTKNKRKNNNTTVADDDDDDDESDDQIDGDAREVAGPRPLQMKTTSAGMKAAMRNATTKVAAKRQASTTTTTVSKSQNKPVAGSDDDDDDDDNVFSSKQEKRQRDEQPPQKWSAVLDFEWLPHCWHRIAILTVDAVHFVNIVAVPTDIDVDRIIPKGKKGKISAKEHAAVAAARAKSSPTGYLCGRTSALAPPLQPSAAAGAGATGAAATWFPCSASSVVISGMRQKVVALKKQQETITLDSRRVAPANALSAAAAAAASAPATTTIVVPTTCSILAVLCSKSNSVVTFRDEVQNLYGSPTALALEERRQDRNGGSSNSSNGNNNKKKKKGSSFSAPAPRLLSVFSVGQNGVLAATAVTLLVTPISKVQASQALQLILFQQQQQRPQRTDEFQTRKQQLQQDLQSCLAVYDTRIDICIVGAGACAAIATIGGVNAGLLPQQKQHQTPQQSSSLPWLQIGDFRPDMRMIAAVSGSDWNKLFNPISQQQQQQPSAAAATTTSNSPVLPAVTQLRLLSDLSAAIPIGLVSSSSSSSSSARFLAVSFSSVIQVDIPLDTSRLVIKKLLNVEYVSSSSSSSLSSSSSSSSPSCLLSLKSLWGSQEDVQHEVYQARVHKMLLGLSVHHNSGELCSMLFHGQSGAHEWTRLFICSHGQYSCSGSLQQQQQQLVNNNSSNTSGGRNNNSNINKAPLMLLRNPTASTPAAVSALLSACIDSICRSVFEQALFLRNQFRGRKAHGPTVYDVLREAIAQQHQWPPTRLLVHELGGAAPTQRAMSVRRMNAVLWHGALMMQHEQLVRSAELDREEEEMTSQEQQQKMKKGNDAAAASACALDNAEDAEDGEEGDGSTRPAIVQTSATSAAAALLMSRKPRTHAGLVFASLVDAIADHQERQEASAAAQVRSLQVTCSSHHRSIYMSALHFLSRMNMTSSSSSTSRHNHPIRGGVMSTNPGAFMMLSSSPDESASEITAAQVESLRQEAMRELILVNCLRLICGDAEKQDESRSGIGNSAPSSVSLLSAKRRDKAVSRAWSWLVKFCRKNSGEDFAQTLSRAQEQENNINISAASSSMRRPRATNEDEKGSNNTAANNNNKNSGSSNFRREDETPNMIPRPTFCSMLLRTAIQHLRARRGFPAGIVASAATAGYDGDDPLSMLLAQEDTSSECESMQRCPFCSGEGEDEEEKVIGVPLNFFDGVECPRSCQTDSRPHLVSLSSITFLVVPLLDMVVGQVDEQQAKQKSGSNASSDDDDAGGDGEEAERHVFLRYAAGCRDVAVAKCLVCGCVEPLSDLSAHPLCLTCGGLLSL